MNSKIIRYILGYVLKIEGILLLLPSLVAAIYHETSGFYYMAVGILCMIIGMVFSGKKPDNSVFYLKEGCITTALSWICLSIFGALPPFLSGEIPSYLDSLFESVSGFTTTGCSVLSDVEALSHCTLFWRSLTNWIGGMGVLVFLLAIVPLTGGSHMNLMKAESPGPSVGKLVPKVRHTARILYFIYIGMTIIELIILLCARMNWFEAVCTSLSTAGTGGFGFKNDSFESFSPFVKWTVTIFMILFGINFNAYYLIIFRQFKKAFSMEEVRAYLGIIVVSIAVIFAQLMKTSMNTFDALTDAAFQVASIITTTGFSTADFNQWSQTSKTILVLLMFVGGCAGSTSGGIKVSRFLILFKTLGKELKSYLHPKNVSKIRFDGKAVEHEVVRATNVYMVTFIIMFSISVLLISIEGKDLITNFTAVTATINNIGPGLELVGPAQNFSCFNGFSKCILIINMLAGRLELFPLLLLFHPGIWKDMLVSGRKRNV